MMIFPSSMHPTALLQNKGAPHPFTCDFCGTTDDGVLVQPDDSEREAWAVLPEGWEEIEDRRADAKKKFPICCTNGDCSHTAQIHSD